MAPQTPSPIATVEELLKEVKAIYGDGGIAASQDTYEAKKRVQLLADKVKREVLGPLEYTILIGGALCRFFVFLSLPFARRVQKAYEGPGTLESCQESSALRFITELGVADAIGDDTKTLLAISEHVGVPSRYLGTSFSSFPPAPPAVRCSRDRDADLRAQAFR